MRFFAASASLAPARLESGLLSLARDTPLHLRGSSLILGGASKEETRRQSEYHVSYSERPVEPAAHGQSRGGLPKSYQLEFHF